MGERFVKVVGVPCLSILVIVMGRRLPMLDQMLLLLLLPCATLGECSSSTNCNIPSHHRGVVCPRTKGFLVGRMGIRCSSCFACCRRRLGAERLFVVVVVVVVIVKNVGGGAKERERTNYTRVKVNRFALYTASCQQLSASRESEREGIFSSSLLYLQQSTPIREKRPTTTRIDNEG